jgi:cytochrome c-type biogenesis protein CcsB
MQSKALKYTTLGLCGLVVLSLVAATVVEKLCGTAQAHSLIYGSWWFVALWTLAALSACCYALRSRLYRRPATFLLHCSFVVILAGGLLTWLFAERGTVHLRTGEETAAFELSDGGTAELPFSLRLDDFEVSYYSGNVLPSDYSSSVSVTDAAGCGQATISMNHILSRSGYRVYQAGYDSDSQGASFSVSHDPWGTGVSYCGYALLLLSILLYCFTDKHFRQLFRKAFATAAAVCIFALGAFAAPKTLPRDVAEEFGELYVCYQGRVCPLQTVAKDFTTKLYGSFGVQGYSDEQVLTGWMFYHSSWKSQPQHSRRNASDATDKSRTVNSLYNGALLKLYPCADTLGVVQWYSQSDNLPEGIPNEQWLFIRKSWDYIFELVMNGEYGQLSDDLARIRQYQRKVAGDELPSDFRISAERLYNSFPPLFPMAGISLIAGVLLLALVFAASLKGSAPDVRVRGGALLVCALMFLYLSAMVATNWIAAAHIPLSNGPETMMAIAWTALLLGLVLGGRIPVLRPFSLIAGGLAMAVSGMGSANPAVTQLVPVLSSPLLSIHVSLVMLSYTLFALMMLNGAAALVLSAGKPDARRLDMVSRMADLSHALILPGVFFLALGIFAGAIWANVSWGTYWSWDPKETWALITLMIYAAGIHTTSLQRLSSPRAFHLFTVLAFIAVLVTYFGVNFFLGGMHSYAG